MTLADRLRSELTRRYPAFAHKGVGKVGLSLSSADWREIIAALQAADCMTRNENRHMVITPRVVDGLRLLKAAKADEIRRLLTQDWGSLLSDDVNVIAEADGVEGLLRMAIYTYNRADEDLRTVTKLSECRSPNTEGPK